MKPKIFFVFGFSGAPPGKILTFLFLYHTIFLRPRTSKNRNPRPYFYTTPDRDRIQRIGWGWGWRSSSQTPPGTGLQADEPGMAFSCNSRRIGLQADEPGDGSFLQLPPGTVIHGIGSGVGADEPSEKQIQPTGIFPQLPSRRGARWTRRHGARCTRRRGGGAKSDGMRENLSLFSRPTAAQTG